MKMDTIRKILPLELAVAELEEISTTREILPVALTMTEKIEFGAALSSLYRKREEAEQEKKIAVAQASSTIKQLDGEIRHRATCINQGYEPRPVECLSLKDWTGHRVVLVRVDTGELIRERAMTEIELQRSLQGP